MSDPQQPELTDAEQAKRDEHIADLMSHGYQPIDEIDGFGAIDGEPRHGDREIPLRIGGRVRLRNRVYYDAIRNGHAVVLDLLEKNPSPWARSWHLRDVEIVVLEDKPMFEDWSRISLWAGHSTQGATEAAGATR